MCLLWNFELKNRFLRELFYKLKRVFFVLKVSVDGYITFNRVVTTGTPVSYPQSGNAIAVFFADVSPVCGTNRITGNVFYRISNG